MKLGSLSLSLSAQRGGGVTVPDAIAPLLTDLSASGDSLSFNTDEGGTAHWLVDNTASYADCDALIAAQGSGTASGSFAAASGAVTESIDLSGVANGTYKLHVGMLDTAGNASNVLTTDLTVNIADPAMSVDASALFWYAPDSVTDSGGVASLITDKTGNGYDLDTIPTGATGPAFDGAKLTFNGTDTMMLSSVNGPIKDTLFTNADEVMIFLVADLYSPVGAGDSLSGFRTSLAEGAASGNNETTQIKHTQTNGTQSYDVQSRRFSDAASTTYNAAPYTKSVFCATITQSAMTTYLNGTQVATAAVTPANFPQAAGKIQLGGRGSASAFTASNILKGDVYEVFVTHDASSANRTAITEELAGLHGITL